MTSTDTAEGSRQPTSLLQRAIEKINPQRNGIPIIFILLVVVFAVLKPQFVDPANLASIVRGASVIGIIAVGMTLVMVGGGFDLSVARVAALSGVVVGTLNQSGPLLAIGGTLLVAVGIGLTNGILVTKAKVNPFVVTLGMMSIAASLSLVVADGETKRDFAPWLNELAAGDVWPIPKVTIYFLIAAIVCHVLLAHTRYGRYIYAAGGNPEAARLAGIRVDRVIASTYVLVAVLSAIAGIVLVSRLQSATSDAIAAVIIGGTRLGGGVGSVPRTVLGVLILSMLSNALVLFGVDAFWQGALKGSIIIAAVAFDALTSKRRS
jgi:ribose/xylose/arabinose/galactoside ABC-type transport system permease subunit